MTYGDDFSAVLRAVAAALAEKDNVVLQPLEQQLLHVLLRNPNSKYSQIRNIIYKDHRRDVSEGHLRNIATKLWKKLRSILGTKIGKENVVAELRTWYGRKQLPDVFGRYDLVYRLTTQYLQNNYYRVVCVTGMPRIGKSTLVGAAINLLRKQGRDGHLIPDIHWREAERIPTVADLLHWLSRRIYDSSHDFEFPEDPVEALIDELRRHEFLLVIDDADVLYDTTSMSGQLRADTGYVSFLKQVVRDPTLHGQVLWISRVMPSCLDESYSTLHRFEVPPLAEEDAVSLLKDKRLDTDNPVCLELLKLCAGYPGLLKTAATKIPDSSESSIRDFLSDPLKSSVLEDECWFKIIAELSFIERQLGIWLILCPLSYENISRLKITLPPDLSCIDALQSLQQRGLLKLDAQGYYQLHPPYLRYALANWLVQYISELLPVLDVAELRHYPLTLPTAPAFHRKWQQQHILQPLQEAIREHYWDQPAQREWFSTLLKQIPKKSSNRDGQPSEGCFGIGNLLSLAGGLAASVKGPLQNFSLKGHIVRCADLQNVALRDICLVDCLFEQTELPICLQDPICMDLAADGKAIAIGDAAGRICYWVEEGGVFLLEQYYRLSSLDDELNAVDAITLDDEALIITVGRQIYHWWLSGDEHPERLCPVSGTVTAVAQCRDFIAIGFNDGAVGILDRVFNTWYCEQMHRASVHCLAFSETGEGLISVGSGNRLLCWNLVETPPVINEERPVQDRILQSVRCYNGRILRAGTISKANYDCPSIDNGNGTWQDIDTLRGVTQLTFSHNGQYLVGCDAKGNIYLWQYPFITNQLTISLEDMPQKLVISDDGQSLLAVYASVQTSDATKTQLWKIDNGQLLWEMRTSCPPPHGLRLENVTGLSPAIIKHLAEFSSNA